MILINEWLPNPVGSDVAGEFVELYNNSSSAVALTGWAIQTEKGKQFSLAGKSISPHGYLLLPRSETALTLRNTDGGLILRMPGGAIADRGAFAGGAPEGKSFSRVNDRSGIAAHFMFSLPTPGMENSTPLVFIATTSYQYHTPLDPQFTIADFFAIMMGTAVLVAGLVCYIVQHHEDLSKLFSGRNHGHRRKVGKEDPGGAPRRG